MITTVEISDNEDADDCVIKSVIYVVDDESESELYHEVYKENKLLADFIEKCLKIENSEGMLQTLKGCLLKHYYEADRSARESLKFEKNLRRANYHLKSDPSHVYTHIKCLCIILNTLRVKNRGLSIKNRTAKSCRSIGHKRCNTEELDIISSTSKKAKLDSNILPSSENIINISCDALEESMSMETYNQQRSTVEDDKLLIAKKYVPIPAICIEKRIRAIENKIAKYKKSIAMLDELEVEDDSINSPYIQSERLKAKVVSLYNKRCQLLGSQPAKFKGICLRLRDGHPPGPTRILEKFLNTNINKNGDPPFPDFCDVVNCVTEANNKDGLGWTKSQIMNEACGLFTLCGRALQKRRQIREYQDLLYKVKLEDERDPADNDPELRAKLEQNTRIAVKKESEILERYTRMQYFPRESKTQVNCSNIENKGNGNIGEANPKTGTEQELTHFNTNSKHLVVPITSMENGENSKDNTAYKLNDKNIINVPNCNVNTQNQKSQNTICDNIDKCLKEGCSSNEDVDKKDVTEPLPAKSIHTKVDATEHCVNQMMLSKAVSNDADECIKPDIQVKSKISSEKESSDLNIITTPETDATKMFKSPGDDFTVKVEIMNELESSPV